MTPLYVPKTPQKTHNNTKVMRAYIFKMANIYIYIYIYIIEKCEVKLVGQLALGRRLDR